MKKVVNTLKISLQVILKRLSFNKNDSEEENENKIIHNTEVADYLYKLEKKTN